MVLGDVFRGATMRTLIIKLRENTEPLFKSVRTFYLPFEGFSLSSPYSDFFRVALAPQAGAFSKPIMASQFRSSHARRITERPILAPQFYLLFVSLIPIGVLLFMQLGVFFSPSLRVKNALGPFSWVSTFIVFALCLLAVITSTAFRVCRDTGRDVKIMTGQGVNLRNRFTNLARLVRCSNSLRAICILP